MRKATARPTRTRRSETPTQEGPRIVFERYVVQKASFEETANRKRDLRDGEAEFSLQVQIASRVFDDRQVGEVRLELVLTGHPETRPCLVNVVVLGLFRSDPDRCAREDFVEFCRVGGARLLLPFVRAMVHTLTTDARYGPVLLDPIQLIAHFDNQLQAASNTAAP